MKGDVLPTRRGVRRVAEFQIALARGVTIAVALPEELRDRIFSSRSLSARVASAVDAPVAPEGESDGDHNVLGDVLGDVVTAVVCDLVCSLDLDGDCRGIAALSRPFLICILRSCSCWAILLATTSLAATAIDA